MLLSKALEGIWNYWRTLSNHPPRCRYGRFEFWGFYFFEKCGRCGDRVPKMLYRGPVKNKKNLWHWVVIIFGCVCHATSIDYRSIGRLSRSQSWSPGPWWLDKQEFLSGKKKSRLTSTITAKLRLVGRSKWSWGQQFNQFVDSFALVAIVQSCQRTGEIIPSFSGLAKRSPAGSFPSKTYRASNAALERSSNGCIDLLLRPPLAGWDVFHRPIQGDMHRSEVQRLCSDGTRIYKHGALDLNLKCNVEWCSSLAEYPISRPSRLASRRQFGLHFAHCVSFKPKKKNKLTEQMWSKVSMKSPQPTWKSGQVESLGSSYWFGLKKKKGKWRGTEPRDQSRSMAARQELRAARPCATWK